MFLGKPSTYTDDALGMDASLLLTPGNDSGRPTTINRLVLPEPLAFPSRPNSSGSEISEGEQIPEIRSEFTGLLGYRYWQRAWVIQEIALAKRIRLLCGNRDLVHPVARELIRRLGHETGTNASVDAIARFSMSTAPDILNVVVETRKAQCSNPRDIVFAKLALARNGHLVGQPNYTESVEICFTRFALSHIRHTSTLDVLRYAGENEETPSWVLNWTDQWDLG